MCRAIDIHISHQSVVGKHSGMDSEKKCEDLKKILEPEKNKSSTLTQLDIDIWNLELRTNNVCLDEYTVGERLKHLRYLEELNRGRTQSFEAREEACLV